MSRDLRSTFPTQVWRQTGTTRASHLIRLENIILLNIDHLERANYKIPGRNPFYVLFIIFVQHHFHCNFPCSLRLVKALGLLLELW